jgi:opacity protein-like surface antigen
MKPPSKASVYRRFRLVAAAAVSAMAFAVPAVAADMPLKVPDVVVPPPLWTGFYIGVHGGWGWNRTQIHDLLLSTPPNSIFQTSTDGPIGGGQIGVNWQYYNLVYGLEFDGDVASIRGNVSRDFNLGVIAASTNTVAVRWMVTATARAGYAWGPWLAYAKAGVVAADQTYTIAFTAAGRTDYDQVRTGPTAGVGMEVAFMRNVSAKNEYNFMYLRSASFMVNVNGFDDSVDHFVSVVKAGINVRFGG